MQEWVERPYGWKMELGKGHQLLRIRPEHHTSMSSGEIAPFGLKKHPILCEVVRFLGYADGPSDNGRCLYYGRMADGYVESMFFCPGESFVSVYTNGTGRYHQLSNLSENDIILEVFQDE
ncbi:MAG: hypothetical protein HY513_01510 [Candidatus Aenigmarchaeota archaeon]|nr:hypothetical protein [Candidatus Aenigmarchaeota archaeon]